jgi:hypothetical protein
MAMSSNDYPAAAAGMFPNRNAGGRRVCRYVNNRPFHTCPMPVPHGAVGRRATRVWQMHPRAAPQGFRDARRRTLARFFSW